MTDTSGVLSQSLLEINELKWGIKNRKEERVCMGKDKQIKEEKISMTSSQLSLSCICFL